MPYAVKLIYKSYYPISNKHTGVQRRIVIKIGVLRMKRFVNKTFLAIVAVVLVAGTAFFASCEKDSEKQSRETINNNSKSEINDELYKSLLKKHDYSFYMENNHFRRTIFGRLNNDTIGCSEYINNKLYKYLYISHDENFLGIDKIDENTAIVHIDGCTSKENKIVFDKVEQIGDSIEFQIVCNDVLFAKCKFTMPYINGKFMDLLPIVIDNSKASIPDEVIDAIVTIVTSILNSDIFSLFKPTDQDVDMRNMCYQSMNENVSKCIDNGGSPTYSHTRKHRRCSFSCNMPLR